MPAAGIMTSYPLSYNYADDWSCVCMMVYFFHSAPKSENKCMRILGKVTLIANKGDKISLAIEVSGENV